MVKFIFADTKNRDIYYMLGMDLADPVFLVDTGRKKRVFLDYRELGVFESQKENNKIEANALEPVIQEAEKENKDNTEFEKKVALYLITKYKIINKEIGVPNSFPLDLADYLRAKGVKLKVLNPFIPERLKKQKEEVGKIKNNLTSTKKAFQKIEEILKESHIKKDELRYKGKILTSEFLKKEVRMVLIGEELMDIEGMIISCASQAAIPHHSGSGPIRPHQTIICDIFPRSRKNGYFADMTRTYVKGKASEEMKEMYATVKIVQEKAIEAIRSGVRGVDIHNICVEEFLKKGHKTGEKGFAHGTGHGLGLDIHEGPYLNARYGRKLEIGNVVTVEPGLYYPKIGGVRIEDVVCVTKNGCINLTSYPKHISIA